MIYVCLCIPMCVSSCACTGIYLCVSVFVCSMEELEMWSEGPEECVSYVDKMCVCVNQHQYSAGWALVWLDQPQRKNTVCILPIGPFTQYIFTGYFQETLHNFELRHFSFSAEILWPWLLLLTTYLLYVLFETFSKQIAVTIFASSRFLGGFDITYQTCCCNY